jgi:hypothetical protein
LKNARALATAKARFLLHKKKPGASDAPGPQFSFPVSYFCAVSETGLQ